MSMHPESLTLLFVTINGKNLCQNNEVFDCETYFFEIELSQYI